LPHSIHCGSNEFSLNLNQDQLKLPDPALMVYLESAAYDIPYLEAVFAELVETPQIIVAQPDPIAI
jgi:hypothetical protein